MLINKDKSLLLIIDIQEKITPATSSPREVLSMSQKLVKSANRLDIPLMITEQYPKGLGPTMFDVINEAKVEPLAKIEFSAAKNEAILKALQESGKNQVIISGVETHICVLQTAIDLEEKGFEVFVVADACSSRENIEHVFALQRLMRNNINVVTFEMVLFEWLEKAGTGEFKELSSLVKKP